MKRLTCCLVWLFTFSLFSQTEKGAIIVSSNNRIFKGTTRAVVIGISDYENESISDLKYAHKDAVSFANWLKSPAGGSLPPDNILLHTNEKATNAQII